MEAHLRTSKTGVTFGPVMLERVEDLWRVIDVPDVLSSEHVDYMDLLRLDRVDDDVFELVEVVRSGGWRRFEYVLHRASIGSTELERFLDGFEQRGGAWCLAMGGCLSLLLPPDTRSDPTEELRAALGQPATRT